MAKILQVSTDKIQVFKILFETLEKIFSEINIYFNKRKDQDNDVANGYMKILEFEPTKTFLVDLRLYEDYFNKFYCENDLIVGIDLREFNEILKTVDENDLLTMYIDSDDTYNLRLVVDQDHLNNVPFNSTIFSLKILDITPEKITLPNYPTDRHITMGCNEFHVACENMSKLYDHVELECFNDKFTIKCNKSQTKILSQYENVTIKVAQNQMTCAGPNRQNTCNDLIKGTYNLRNFTTFNNFTKIFETLGIFMSYDFPLIIKYDFSNKSRLFLVISQVEEEFIKCDYGGEGCTENRIEEKVQKLKEKFQKLEEKFRKLEIYKKLLEVDMMFKEEKIIL